MLPLLILVLGALALYVDFFPNAKFVSLTDSSAGFGQTMQTKLGLDISGGFQLLYQTVDGQGNPVQPGSDQMKVIRSIVEDRVNSTGAVEPVVAIVGSNQILIQVPGATNSADVENLVGHPGNLTFVLLPPEQYGTDSSSSCPTMPNSTCLAHPTKGDLIDPSLPAQFSGKDLNAAGISASVNQDSAASGAWQINFEANSAKAKEFETWTGAHVGDFFAIVLDGVVQSAPSLQSQLTGGSGRITGSFTKVEAQNLANILTYGALPYPLGEGSSSAVPATLGSSFLNKTLFAGAIGIALVALFMVAYYRLPGVIAVLALSYYAVAVLALFRMVPVTLTLAGIAGFVLSVGMAVDANILIFERTKEELRTGKTLPTAIEAGFSRAWNSILDSNVSSLITASILYFLGSPTIRGFALVLIIGVATSMFTAVTVSRTLLRFIVKQDFAQRAWLFGVTDEEFQARSMGGRSTRREARARV
jgi:preprotein translocase subunit SecD